MEGFSARLIKALQSKAMTQKELAKAIGTTEATISRYMSGEREPKAETIAAMANVLSTTSDYLLGLETDEEYNFSKMNRLIARNASKLTNEEKKLIINALFEEK